MGKVFYLLPVLFLGCSHYITNQELSSALQEASSNTRVETSVVAETASLAVYECIYTTDTMRVAQTICTDSSNTSPYCELNIIWNSFCNIWTATGTSTPHLLSPRPGVRIALGYAIENIHNYGSATDPSNEEHNQIDYQEFIRTPE